MRKLIAVSLLFALAGASVAFAANHVGGSSTKKVDRECQVMALSELTKDMIEDFFIGKTPQIVLECSQGSILPFSLSLKGEFLALDVEDSQCKVTVLKTCFIKRVDDIFLFSTDLQNWKEFQEFFAGVGVVSLNVKEGTPTAGFTLELNQRT